MLNQKPPPGKRSAIAIMENARLFNMTPAFHAAGISSMTFNAVWLSYCSVVPPPSNKPLDGAAVADALKYANADGALVVPSILEDMSKNPTLSNVLDKVQFMIWSGGALPPEAGERLKNKTELISYVGSTEIGVYHHLLNDDPDDWKYVAIHDCCNVEFRRHADDLYEAIVIRSEEHAKYQPIWHVFPDLLEYPTRDLYTKHPTKPDLWTHVGRIDDIIVFVNGEKINPISIEDRVSSHKAVRSALVSGEGRFQAALIVEPMQFMQTTAEKARLLEEIWPLVEKANEESPAHGQISKAHILFTTAEKPMLRAGKGTVQRKLTLNAYANELNALYADAESMTTGAVTSENINGFDKGSSESLILSIVQRMIRHDIQITADDDFFSHGGLDSLQVLQLVRQLQGHSILGENDKLSPLVIYNNPTASSLAKALESLKAASEEKMIISSKIKTQEMLGMLSQFSGPRDRDEIAPGRPEVILLTGSTGAVGSYLLDSLLKSERVKKTYCLGRAVSVKRQREISASKGLPTVGFADKSKVEFFRADLTLPSFGLDGPLFEELSASVTRIVHCAWPVDFNLSLQSFTSQLQALRALIDFAAFPKQSPKSILFLSSVSSVGNWQAPSSSPSDGVPETPLSDFSLPLASGYAESKFVGEQLLLRSSSLVDASIVRVGQVAGPVLSDQGIWKEEEWIPSLIRSSQYLKMLPASLGAAAAADKDSKIVDWVPVDLLAHVLTDLTLLPKKESRTVFHAVNPRPVSWESLIPAIRRALITSSHSSTDPASKKEQVEVVSYTTWLSALRASAAPTLDKQAWDANPAIKLMDFYESLARPGPAGMVVGGGMMPRFGTEETQRRSGSLREMREVSGQDMERWIHGWGV